MLLTTALITEVEGEYLPTAEGKRLYVCVNQEGRNVFERLDHLTKLLRVQFGDVKVKDHVALCPADVRQAYVTYYEGT